jgi:hypothetical protein
VKLSKWFENVNLTKVKLTLGFMDAEWEPNDPDRDAAWELYVEMLTRIVTQPLPDDAGDEKAALDSVYQLFPTTRAILRARGRDCIQFTKVAVVVLNQIVRPFTAKWHRASLAGAFSDAAKCQEFRAELAELQVDLVNYTRLLAQIAHVEDLTQVLATEAQ